MMEQPWDTAITRWHKEGMPEDIGFAEYFNLDKIACVSVDNSPSRGPGWWRYRIPGWGQVKWRELFKIFYDAGYKGPVIIEHEDPVFDGKLHIQGLKMGHDFLRGFDLPDV